MAKRQSKPRVKTAGQKLKCELRLKKKDLAKRLREVKRDLNSLAPKKRK